jgi:hypothetical protein
MNIIVAIFRLNIPTLKDFWIYLYNQRPLSFKYTLPNFLLVFSIIILTWIILRPLSALSLDEGLNALIGKNRSGCWLVQPTNQMSDRGRSIIQVNISVYAHLWLPLLPFVNIDKTNTENDCSRAFAYLKN